MKKLGVMHNPAEDFEDPLLPEQDPLLRHVLYKRRDPLVLR